MLLGKQSIIGSVVSVKTDSITIIVENSDIFQTLQINNFVAIETPKSYINIIGLIKEINKKQIPLQSISSTEENFENNQNFSNDWIIVSLIGTFYKGSKDHKFSKKINLYPQISAEVFLIKGSNLRMFVNKNNDEKDSNKINLGSYIIDSKIDALLDGDNFFQKHAAILGSTGSGKSWTIATILEEINKLNSSNAIVFDIHGEYKNLTKSSNTKGFAKYYRIAGPTDKFLENSTEEAIFIPFWMLNINEALAIIIDNNEENAPTQTSRFIFHMTNLKNNKNNENYKCNIFIEEDMEENIENEANSNELKVSKNYTVNSPIPYSLNDMLKRLNCDNKKKQRSSRDISSDKGSWTGKQTDWYDKFHSFILKINQKKDDKRYNFMFHEPDSGWTIDYLKTLFKKLISTDNNDKIKIIDFSNVPFDVLPIVIGLLARLLFDLQLWMRKEDRKPFAIFCDEAHLYLPKRNDANGIEKQSLFNFERIAKEGRKFGISLVTISQRPSDISQTILSQSNNFIILKLTNPNDKATINNLLLDASRDLLSELPILDTGECIVIGDSIVLPNKIKIKIPNIKPSSKNFDFIKEWSNGDVSSNEKRINQAIDNFLKQSNEE